MRCCLIVLSQLTGEIPSPSLPCIQEKIISFMHVTDKKVSINNISEAMLNCRLFEKDLSSRRNDNLRYTKNKIIILANLGNRCLLALPFFKEQMSMTSL